MQGWAYFFCSSLAGGTDSLLFYYCFRPCPFCPGKNIHKAIHKWETFHNYVLLLFFKKKEEEVKRFGRRKEKKKGRFFFSFPPIGPSIWLEHEIGFLLVCFVSSFGMCLLWVYFFSSYSLCARFFSHGPFPQVGGDELAKTQRKRRNEHIIGPEINWSRWSNCYIVQRQKANEVVCSARSEMRELGGRAEEREKGKRKKEIWRFQRKGRFSLPPFTEGKKEEGEERKGRKEQTNSKLPTAQGNWPVQLLLLLLLLLLYPY